MKNKTNQELKLDILNLNKSYNKYVLKKIVKRLSLINGLSLYSIYTLKQVDKTTKDLNDIDEELGRMVAEQLSLMAILFRQVAYRTYNDTKAMFDYKKRPFTPLSKDVALSSMITNTINGIRKDYLRGMNNLAYDVDINNRGQKVVNGIKTTYKNVINHALSNKGALDNVSAKKLNDDLVYKLAKSQLLNVMYDKNGKRSLHNCNGWLDGLLENGMWQIKQDILDYVGKLLGTDGIELSAHIHPAPDHSPVQGHQFSNENFEKMQSNQMCRDVQGRYYSAFVRKIGEWNCRHLVYPIFVGFNEQEYSDDQLKDILDENVKGIILPGGKHLTLYEYDQKLKSYENKINHLQDSLDIARTYGNSEMELKYKMKLSKALKDYNALKSFGKTKSKIKLKFK